MSRSFEISTAVFYPSGSHVKYPTNHSRLNDIFPADNIPPLHFISSKREEFIRLICDVEHELLMAWRGGIALDNDLSESSIELVQSLTDDDWDKIVTSKKKIVGYSDVTYLLCALLNHGVTCYYGPNYESTLLNCCNQELETTLHYLKLALTSTEDYTIDFCDKSLTVNGTSPWVMNGGRCSGRLIGGNLDTICTLITRFSSDANLPLQEGDILLLEENDPTYIKKDTGYFINHFLTLESVGVFDRISGLLIGQSSAPHVLDVTGSPPYSPITNQDETNYLCAALRCVNLPDIPILANVACSHTHPMVTLPLGTNITLDADKKSVTVHV